MMFVKARGASCALWLLGEIGLAASAYAGAMPTIEPRILAQEGLAIGLASNVLQSQLLALVYGTAKGMKCHKLDGGGSAQLIEQDKKSHNVVEAKVTIFYDPSCTQSYIDVDDTFTSNKDGSVDATGSAAYLGLTGAKLGVLTVSESVTPTKKDYVLIGTGTFTPQDGAQSVSLGLECTVPSKGKTLTCQGGVAQTFPSLNLSLASVTPLTLTMKKNDAVTFIGSSSDMQTGAAGSLSIVQASPNSLGIAGNGTPYASPSTKGEAGAFVLFPPQPTQWTITDTANDAQFSITVVSNTARNLRGSVKTISKGANLASIKVDQSGTGSISYADGGKSLIKGWLLGD